MCQIELNTPSRWTKNPVDNSVCVYEWEREKMARKTLKLSISQWHFLCPSHDFEYLSVSNPDSILWQCSQSATTQVRKSHLSLPLFNICPNSTGDPDAKQEFVEHLLSRGFYFDTNDLRTLVLLRLVDQMMPTFHCFSLPWIQWRDAMPSSFLNLGFHRLLTRVMTGLCTDPTMVVRDITGPGRAAVEVGRRFVLHNTACTAVCTEVYPSLRLCLGWAMYETPSYNMSVREEQALPL